MVKTIQTMYGIAARCAIENGPRVTESVNGKPIAAYFLTKAELKDLFRKNGYNVKGITWLNYIDGWKETWGEVAPSFETLKDPRQNNWCMFFIHVNKAEYNDLMRYGQDNEVKILAVEP